MFYQNMPLYLRLVNLLKVEYEVVHNLPKEYKFSLGEDIIRQTWDLIDSFIVAQIQASQREEKIKIICAMNRKFDCLKLRIRFLSELKLITLPKAGQFIDLTVEIGKMLGSWQKNV